jgi:hypothetical protein
MASYKTLLVPIIQEILIKEIGEANIEPLEWEKVSPTKYQFTINIYDSTEVVTVYFEQVLEDARQFYFPPKYRHLNRIYNVGYDVSGTEIQFAKTDLKTLLSVLSTIIDIIKDFIKNHYPKGLFIMGTAKEIGSKDISKKTNLYKAFIGKQLQQIPNFNFDTYKDGFILVKD